MRTIQTLLDVIREYPEYAAGSQRWDDRVFHPDPITNCDRPVSFFWDTPPVFLERIFSAIRLIENNAVQRILSRMFAGSNRLDRAGGNGCSGRNCV